MWYLWLLPLALPRLELSTARGVSLLIVWIGGQVRLISWALRKIHANSLHITQALWLSQAYRLEMLGEATYLNVWAAGIIFFGVNCWVLGEVIRSHRSTVEVKHKLS